MLTPTLQIQRSTRVRKTRELPCRGTVLCKVGDTVSGETVVAKATVPGELEILRVAERLQLEAEEAISVIRVAVGDTVTAGQCIAEHTAFFGLLRSQFHAPYSGVIEFITAETGNIGLRLPERSIGIPAYISGTVVEVLPERAAIIESNATFIQGIFGVGGERQGIINLLPIACDKIVEESDIPTDCTGAILVGGTRPTAQAVKRAAAAGAVALITGAIDDYTLQEYLGYDLGIALTGDEEISMTIIVTEGFGSMPLSERVYALLRECAGKKASVNGTTQVRAGAQRPEIIIAHTQPVATNEEPVRYELTKGTKIRIIREPYFGVIATIEELPSALEVLPSGVMARIVRARCSDGAVVTVARSNVEIVG